LLRRLHNIFHNAAKLSIHISRAGRRFLTFPNHCVFLLTDSHAWGISRAIMSASTTISPGEKISIPVDDKHSLSMVFSLPTGVAAVRETAVIIAHGAGNDMHHPLLADVAAGLAAGGYPVARFNFPYKEAGRKAPDTQAVLEDSWLAAAAYLQKETSLAPAGIMAAGKSLGGRVASQLVAAGRLSVRGLIFLGYPLHPPGQPEHLRNAHFAAIGVPMLFFAGTRDPLCDLAVLRPVLKRLTAPWDLSLIDGGDHSLALPAAAGIPPEKIHANITARIIRWLKAR